MNAALTSSRDHTWETPASVFADLDAEFGFTLDPCCEPGTAKCLTYFTPETDGLARSWAGHVAFCNPPYGRAIGKWVRKCADEAAGGATVVMLIPARVDAGYWHDIIFPSASEVFFVRGRVAFLLGGMAADPAPFPCAVVVFRPGGGPAAVATWAFPK